MSSRNAGMQAFRLGLATQELVILTARTGVLLHLPLLEGRRRLLGKPDSALFVARWRIPTFAGRDELACRRPSYALIARRRSVVFSPPQGPPAAGAFIVKQASAASGSSFGRTGRHAMLHKCELSPKDLYSKFF